MLTVTNLSGLAEPLNNIQGFEMNEEVNGAFTVSFTSFNVDNNPGHVLMEEESIISVEGYDFRVKQLKESFNFKNIIAVSTFYDLGAHQQGDIYGGTRTFDEFIAFTLAGTNWTYANTDVIGSAFIPNYGEDNVIKLLQSLCAAFKCEYKIMPNSHVLFAKEIGPDNEAQYRYGHNVETLSKSTDTTNLRTRIKGYGADGLTIIYTSPNSGIYGIIDAEEITDDDLITADELTDRLKQELIDYPEVTIELDSIELTDKELGERVWLIYEPIGIEFQTRILSKRSIMLNDNIVTASVVVGNTIPRDNSDLLVSQKIEIDNNEKRTRSRIEQTNGKIVLAVERFDGEILEAYSQINLTADEIRSEVSSTVSRIDGRVDSANSSISQLSGEISLKASVTSVDALGSRVNTAEINIDAANSQISLKVDRNGIIGAINLTPELARIQARNVEFVGAVSVLSDITGNLGTITTGRIDIYQDASIGAGLTLRGSGNRTGLYLDKAQITSLDGAMSFFALRDISIGPFTTFNGRVDFSSAIVTGLDSSNGTTVRYSSSSRRLYVDLNGVEQGFIPVT